VEVRVGDSVPVAAGASVGVFIVVGSGVLVGGFFVQVDGSSFIIKAGADVSGFRVGSFTEGKQLEKSQLNINKLGPIYRLIIRVFNGSSSPESYLKMCISSPY